MSDAAAVTVSVVIPAFNEEDTIATTLDRLGATFESSDASLEVVVVSDGSVDRTHEIASKWLAERQLGIAVDLAANVGSHAAVRCGLRHTTGGIVGVISADGQDPPEKLVEMVDVVESGIDVVWGERSSRARDPVVRRLMAGTYYRLFRLVTGLRYPPAGLDFVVMSRTAVDSLLRYRERNMPLFLALFNLGLPTATVPYERGHRTGGESGWTLSKRIRLGLDMLTSYSPAPIRLVSGVGLLIGLLGLAYGAFTVFRALGGGVPVEGWASLMVVSSLMLGTLLVAVGFIGEYLWRTLDEVRDRPLYLERHVVDHRRHRRI